MEIALAVYDLAETGSDLAPQSGLRVAAFGVYPSGSGWTAHWA